MIFKNGQQRRFVGKILLLVAFIYFTNHGFFPRLEVLITERSSYTGTIVFFALWAVAIFTLLIVTFQQSKLIRFFWALLISLVTGAGYGFYVAGGSELDVLDVLELWQARHEAGRALEFFQSAVIQASLVVLFGLIVFMLPPPTINGKMRKALGFMAWLPAIPVILFIALIFVRSDRAIAGLPQQFVPLSIASAVGYKMLTQAPSKRDKVASVSINPKVNHILYLVDESINPNFIYQDDGRLINGLLSNNVADFGVSVSGSNCSARSNAILRMGGTRSNLIEDIHTSPTIWQYAKKAGFRTVYIDAQSTSIQDSRIGGYQNYMTPSEAEFIDKFIKIKDVDPAMLDFELIKRLKTELVSDIPTFVYANKNGAHFPYYKNYPKNEEVHKPISRNRGSKEQMEGVLNSYKNAVRWTVDKFFETFFTDIDLKNMVVIYTSDHGQNVAHLSMPHCSSGEDASLLEGLVPLMLITDKLDLKNQFKTAAKRNFNQTDQFSIFPELLSLLGYPETIQKRYGLGLLDTLSAKNAAFNTGDIMGVLTHDTVWKKVSNEDRVKLIQNAPRGRNYSSSLLE